MIGKFNESLQGWEILCDQCEENIIGYVGQETRPLDNQHFGVTCAACWLKNNPQPEENTNETTNPPSNEAS